MLGVLGHDFYEEEYLLGFVTSRRVRVGEVKRPHSGFLPTTTGSHDGFKAVPH